MATKENLTPITKSSIDTRDYIYIPNTLNLPSYIDLIPDVFEIDDQLAIPSCSANCTTSAIELSLKKYKANPVPLSRLFVYYNTRNLIELAPKQEGASLRDTLKSLQYQGVCYESTWPYKPAYEDIQPIPEAYNQAKSLYYCVTRYERVSLDYNPITTILSAIRDGFPVIIGMNLGEQFLSQHGKWQDQNYPPINDSTNKYIGAHGMLVIGYDNSTNNFLIENSWGKEWGDLGFGSVSYQSVLQDCLEAWIIRSFDNVTFSNFNPVPIKPTPAPKKKKKSHKAEVKNIFDY